MIHPALHKLSTEEKSNFLIAYDSEKLSKGKALIFAFFGLHYFYLGKIGINILFLFTLGGLFIWYFIDLFRINSMVDAKNRGIADNLIHQFS